MWPLDALCGRASRHLFAAAAVTVASVTRRSRTVWPLGALPCRAAEVDSAGEDAGEVEGLPSSTKAPLLPPTPPPTPLSPPPTPLSPPMPSQAADGALVLSVGGWSGEWSSRQLPGTAATCFAAPSSSDSLLRAGAAASEANAAPAGGRASYAGLWRGAICPPLTSVSPSPPPLECGGGGGSGTGGGEYGDGGTGGGVIASAENGK